jgi:DNA anti-recombination protein RmuC
MPLTDQIPDQLKKPTYAVVGAGDAVVERIRGIDVDPKHLQEQAKEFPTKAQARAAEAQVKASERFSTVADDVKHLPEKLRAFPEKAQTVALQALEQAGEVYADLAQRGEGVVNRGRQPEATATASTETAAPAEATKSATTKPKSSASSKKSVSRTKKSSDSAS